MDEKEIQRVVASELHTNLESVGVVRNSTVTLILLHLSRWSELSLSDCDRIESKLRKEASQNSTNLGLIRFL